MEKKGSCFICPVYMKERDYNYAIELFASKLKYEIDAPIIFVFSHDSHKKAFQKRFYDEFGYDYKDGILVPEAGLKYKCQVTLKKLYAVYMLQKEYKYMAVIDCECIFIKHIDVNEVLNEIWSAKSFMVCNKSYLLQHLLKRCVEKLELKSKKQIKKETENYKYNLWFNEVPVYNSDNTAAFFEWLKLKNYEAIFNDYFLVDYYIYILYLMDQEQYKIKKINYWAPLGIMEEITYSNPQNGMQIENEIGTHWSSNKMSKNDKVFMLFHRDHITTDKGYKDFEQYSKYKYIILKIIPKNPKLNFVVEKIADKKWHTDYFKKYRW